MDNCPVEEEPEMKTEEPFTDNDYLLCKTPGKGGWTFAEIPDIPMPKTSFGTMRVKGKTDDHEFSGTHLMPMGNGHVGLAIKTELRKKLKNRLVIQCISHCMRIKPRLLFRKRSYCVWNMKKVS